MRFKVISVVILSFFALIFTQSLKNTQGIIDPNKISGSYDSSVKEAIFENKKVTFNETIKTKVLNDKKILGEIIGPKRIEIDLSQQKLYAYVGDTKIYDFLISSGKWGKTPTGTFHIWGKFRYTKMSGGSKALNTYYYLPNVPYVMYFENDEIPASRGFGIHGTYWHSNFGHPMSHGCINMKTEEAALIYNWADPDVGFDKSGKATIDNPGTEIIIYGVAPES